MPVHTSPFITTFTIQPGYTEPKEVVEPSYPERYIFLVLALAIIIKILRILQRHRLEHEFDEYTSRTGMISNDNYPNSPCLPGYTALPVADISSIVTRPSDDPYTAGVFSLNIHGSEIQPPPEYRVIAGRCAIGNAVTSPPPPYFQPKASPPPPEPLDLPDSDFE